MTQIVLSIPEEKVKTFLSFINDLKYVKVEEKDITIPAWQKKEVKRRQKEISADPSRLLSAKDARTRLNSLKV